MQSPGHLSGDEGNNLFLYSFSANQDRWHKWSILIKNCWDIGGGCQHGKVSPHKHTAYASSLQNK